MKRLCYIDFPVQILILILVGVLAFTDSRQAFPCFYCVLGGWQALIALIYWFRDKAFQSKARKKYLTLMLIALFVIAVCLLLWPVLYLTGWLLLLGGFLLALWNLRISYGEFSDALKKRTVWDLK